MVDDFPTLFKYALDTISCPIMSTECELPFSSAKKLITPERNQLAEDIIDVCEYLKAWWRKSLIEQQFGHFKKQKEVGGGDADSFNSRAEICILQSQTYP